MRDKNDTPETDEMVGYDPSWCGMVPASFARKLERERDAATEDVKRWKKNIIPFLGVHAGAYGRDHYGESCMHYTHYDMLSEAGGRMDDFKRCGDNTVSKTEQ